MSGISVKLPLDINSSDGPYALHKDIKESIKQNLKMLILTIPGERIMDPDFGVGLIRLLFENDSADLRSRIHTRIRSQVRKYMPFLRVRETITPDLNSVSSNSAHILSVKINYFIEPLSEEDLLSIDLTPFNISNDNF